MLLEDAVREGFGDVEPRRICDLIHLQDESCMTALMRQVPHQEPPWLAGDASWLPASTDAASQHCR